jgi:hypothetical protein
MDTRVPPLRVIVADELGQLKGAYAFRRGCAPPPRKPTPNTHPVDITLHAAAQAPDAAHLDSLAVVSRWCGSRRPCALPASSFRRPAAGPRAWQRSDRVRIMRPSAGAGATPPAGNR